MSAIACRDSSTQKAGNIRDDDPELGARATGILSTPMPSGETTRQRGAASSASGGIRSSLIVRSRRECYELSGSRFGDEQLRADPARIFPARSRGEGIVTRTVWLLIGRAGLASVEPG